MRWESLAWTERHDRGRRLRRGRMRSHATIFVALSLFALTYSSSAVAPHPLVHIVDIHGAFGTTPESAAVKVKLVANPSTITLGNSSNLTALVTGGVGWFSYSWPVLPTGCSGLNQSSLNCTPSQTGLFTVTVTVTDSVGKSGSNSTTLQVNSSSSKGNSTGGSSTATGLSPYSVYLFALALGIVAAVVASLLVITFLRRRSRRPPGPLVPERPYIPPKVG